MASRRRNNTKTKSRSNSTNSRSSSSGSGGVFRRCEGLFSCCFESQSERDDEAADNPLIEQDRDGGGGGGKPDTTGPKSDGGGSGGGGGGQSDNNTPTIVVVGPGGGDTEDKTPDTSPETDKDEDKKPDGASKDEGSGGGSSSSTDTSPDTSKEEDKTVEDNKEEEEDKSAEDKKDSEKDGEDKNDRPKEEEFEPWHTFEMEGTKYEEVRRRCLDTNTLYEDPDFPANSSVLFTDRTIMYGVTWRRPGEISRDPVYVKDGMKHPDIHQGSVGNCWFVASVAALAASPQKSLLTRVVPADQGFSKDQYCGAFRFFFWSYGEWKEIIIDDRLPTYNGQLIYAQNKTSPNEYWSPLLEKAFAKFYGSYDKIDGGRISAALVDLTGGISELVSLKHEITEDELKRLLLEAQRMNSFQGGAIFISEYVPGEREVKKNNGLYEGHAYSIIKVKEVKTRYSTTTILHVRNPWGRGEWNGAWSDGSEEWATLSDQDQLGTYKTYDDGEFWISLSDFKNNFDELELCHLTPDAFSQEIADNLERTQWTLTEHRGSWVAGLSAGGPPQSYASDKFWSNPQFSLNLSHRTDPTTVIVSLLQVETPTDGSLTDDISIGFVIFEVKNKEKTRRITGSNYYDFSTRLVATSGKYWPYRERTVHIDLEPTDHVIVPCTFRAGQEATFYMRIFTEGKPISEIIEEEEVKPEPEPTPQPEVKPEPEVTPLPESKPTKDPMEKVFEEKAAGTGLIDAVDLVDVFKAGLQDAGETNHPGFNEETCRCLVALSDRADKQGLLDKPDVDKIWADLALWRRAFKLVDRDGNKSVDTEELSMLFEAVDMYVGKDAIATIMARYGGRNSRVGEEDFLQSFCRAMLASRIHNKLKSKKKIDMTLDEWLTSTLQI